MCLCDEPGMTQLLHRHQSCRTMCPFLIFMSGGKAIALELMVRRES